MIDILYTVYIEFLGGNMKIKVTEMPYDEVLKLPREKHIKPVKQKAVWRKIMKLASEGELKATNFKLETEGMEKLNAGEPALFLMNHSSFTDLQITSTILADRQYHIVMTNDGLIGKASLMRAIGCIPTRKFISDTALVKDMIYAVKELNSSILMFPEASYSFDGTETPLPDSLGKCIKLLGIPVVMIRTKGAFLRDPLYNNLQKRKVNVTAKETYLLSSDDVKTMSTSEINAVLKEAFSYNHFKEQVELGIMIDEEFRADGLERALYKCPNCLKEGLMVGKGVRIKCGSCEAEHELLPSGELSGVSRDAAFKFVPDWYAWERECVKKEIEEGTYGLDIPVDIVVLVDTKSVYKVGSGRLIHNKEGFRLSGCDGKLDFSLSVKKSYSLYADYFWYEIGDMIAIGDGEMQYYCFPQVDTPVAKARLATEELYKWDRGL